MRPEHWLYTIPLRLRSLFRRAQADRDLDDELRDHLERKTEEYVTNGLAPAEARRQALIQLQGIERTKEACRDARRVRWLQDLAQDLHFGLRMLRKSPGFTIVAVLTLALGIGANTAVFSIVSAVLVRGLPFPDPGHLAALFQLPKGTKGPIGWAASGPDIVDWQRESRSFSAIAATVPDCANLAGIASPRYLLGERVTPNYFALLGTHASLGRIFSSREDEKDLDREVILSYEVWRSAFGGGKIIGKSIQLDNRAFVVIGVMPATFHDPRRWMNPESEYWVALPRAELEAHRGEHMYAVFGRLKPGISFVQAQQEMNSIGGAEAKEFPDTNEGFGVLVSRLEDVNLQTLDGGYFHSVSPAILLLQFAAGFLLLLACANIANFMLSHFVGRQRELAMRRALGATGWRLARQMLTESVVLSVIGGIVGILFAYLGKTALLRLAPDGYLPPTANVSLDWRVLCFAAAVAVLSGTFFGVYPAIRARRQDSAALFTGVGGTAGGIDSTSAVRRLLVAFEVAVTFLLVVAAGLMTRSMVSLMDVNPGFNPGHFLTAGINLPSNEYGKPEQLVQFFNAAQHQIAESPGVQAVGFTSSPEMGVNSASNVEIEGRAPRHGDPWPQISIVTPGFFRATGTPLLTGRDFGPADTVGSPKVVLISQSLARYFWPGENPIGAHLKCCGVNNWVEVAGVVGDVRQNGLNAPSRPELYFPLGRDTVQSPMYIVVRSALRPAILTREIENAISVIDPQIPLSDVKTGRQIVQGWAANLPYQTLLLAAFAVMAVVIAVIGIIGAVAYVVACRTHEIGIRMALGAQVPEVLRMIIREEMLPVCVGVAIGIGGSLALTRLLRGFLFQIQPTDAATFITVTVLLTVVAFAACYIPARRAMRVDPMVALRHE